MSTPHKTEINRAEINRASSQHSTGPKTAEGKKQSSLNALRHGLTGQIVVMPSEDLEAYKLHLKSFTDEYHPVGATEANLVQALADTFWRLNRVAALETNLLTLGVGYPARPITDAPQPVQDAISIAASLESQSKALSNLSMHSQRLSRQFERTVAQLRDLRPISGWLRFFRIANSCRNPPPQRRTPGRGSPRALLGIRRLAPREQTIFQTRILEVQCKARRHSSNPRASRSIPSGRASCGAFSLCSESFSPPPR